MGDVGIVLYLEFYGTSRVRRGLQTCQACQIKKHVTIDSSIRTEKNATSIKCLIMMVILDVCHYWKTRETKRLMQKNFWKHFPQYFHQNNKPCFEFSPSFKNTYEWNGFLSGRRNHDRKVNRKGNLKRGNPASCVFIYIV